MLLGFKQIFRDPIENGTKIHTFRANRKIVPKIGERLYMYTSLRTKYARRILGDYTLKGKQKVRMVIESWPDVREATVTTTYKIRLHIGDKREWTGEELHQRAVNDGFENLQAFCDYWTDRQILEIVAFSGHCYHWTDFKY